MLDRIVDVVVNEVAVPDQLEENLRRLLDAAQHEAEIVAIRRRIATVSQPTLERLAKYLRQNAPLGSLALLILEEVDDRINELEE